jgi:hypothetical protein
MEAFALILTLAVAIVFILMILGFACHVLVRAAAFLAKFTYVGLYYMEGGKCPLRLNLPPPQSKKRIYMDVAALFSTLGCASFIEEAVRRFPRSFDLLVKGELLPYSLFVLAFMGLAVIYGVSAATPKDERHWLEKLNALELVPGSWKDIFGKPGQR